jgi:hypothetical protein
MELNVKLRDDAEESVELAKPFVIESTRLFIVQAKG